MHTMQACSTRCETFPRKSINYCGAQSGIDTIETAEQTFMPLMVVAELRAGFLGGSRREENERKLLAFLRKPPVRVLSPDEATTFQYAALFQQLRRQGTPIPIND